MHDFAGFPEELYALRYPAPGAPELAQRIKQQLGDAGFAAGIDASRGLDHGAWVPLRTLFPAADIPVLQLSVQPERCARHHYALGAAPVSYTHLDVYKRQSPAPFISAQTRARAASRLSPA